MSEIFSYDWLGAQLSFLQDSLGLHPLHSLPDRGVLLRHDVDFDVVPALELAQMEHSLGLVGTYFFLATAETYNLKARSVRRIISEISKLGFEVALHFDPSIYPGSEASTLAQKARDEAMSLEDIVGSPVASLSLHNPSVSGQYPIIEGFQNAYKPELFSRECYLSDSRMIFHTEPKAFFSTMSGALGQLLLHPMHYSHSGARYPTQMIKYLERCAANIDYVFRENNSEYRSLASFTPEFDFSSLYATKDIIGI